MSRFSNNNRPSSEDYSQTTINRDDSENENSSRAAQESNQAPVADSFDLATSRAGASEAVSDAVDQVTPDVTNIAEESFRQSIREAAEIIEESFAASREDARTESNIFNYYNSIASITSLQQSEALQLIYNNLSLDKLKKSYKQNISLLSHENYKITAQPIGPLIGKREIISNGPFINPDQICLLKTNYYDNKIDSLKNRYFAKNKYASTHQSVYLDEIKENNIFNKNYIKKLENFVDNNNNKIKDLNFGNQLVRFVKSKDFSNYFGKVSNIVYEKSMRDLSNIGFTNYHLNESYLSLNSNVELEDFSTIRFANLENVLSNYFKITLNNIDDNNILDLNSNSNGIVDSNVLITQVLLNCALSLKNAHEGSFTNTDYDLEDDLNYNIYNTVANNESLKSVSLLSHVYAYNVLDSDDESKINFTSPAFTNYCSLNNEVNRIDFKSDSIYNLKEVYDNNDIQTDHFERINLLQKSNSNVATEYYRFYASDDRELDFSLENVFQTNHNWINKEPYVRDSFYNHNDFSEKLNLTVNDYLCERVNLLDTDGIVVATARPSDGILDSAYYLQFVYFDNESQIRQYDESDSNRIKYLSCPTFNLHSLYQKREADVISQDETFDVISDETRKYNFVATNSIYFRSFKKYILEERRYQRRSPNVLKANIVRLKHKKFADLDSERILYASFYNLKDNLRIDDVYTVNIPGTLIGAIDRMWTIKSGDNVNINSETLLGDGGLYDHRSIRRQYVKMGAGERYALSEEKSPVSILENIPSILDKKYYPFVLVNNTNKIYKYDSDDLKNKFLKDEGTAITTPDEEFYKRVEITSSSRESYKKDEDKNIFEKYNKTSSWGDNKNSWINKAFKLKQNLFSLKKEKLEENIFYSFLKSLEEKSDRIVKRGYKNINNYSFLHSKDDVAKMFSLEESPFLYQSNETFVDTNNYSKSFNEDIVSINNALNILSNNEIESFETFTNSLDFKEYLQIYYPDSTLLNTSSLLYSFYVSMQRILNRYGGNFPISNKKAFGFEKLLVDSLLNNNEVFKYFIYTLIERNFKNNSNSSDNAVAFYRNNDKKSEGLYKTYLSEIFSYENISSQSTFTLRTVDSSFLSNVNRMSLRGNDISTSDSGNGASIARDSEMGFIDIVPGKITNFLFPYEKHEINIKYGHMPIVSGRHDEARLRIQGYQKDACMLFALNSYNYDTYLNINGSDKKSLFSEDVFDGNNLNINIEYITLGSDIQDKFDNFDGETVRSDRIYEANSYPDIYSKFIQVATDPDVDFDEAYEDIAGSLFYKKVTSETFDKDYTEELINEENTFINKLSDVVLNLLTYSFDIDSIKETKTIDFLSSNELTIEKIINISSVFVEMYKFEHDRIKTLSIHRSMEKEVEIGVDYTGNNFWDPNICNKVNESYVKILASGGGSRDYDIKSSKNIFSIDDNNKYFSSKQATDNFSALNLLRKSDYLESTSLDLVFAYLSNFEDNKNKLLSQSKDVFNAAQEIKSMSQEISAIEQVSFSDIVQNKYKVCKMSKLMQNEAYYSDKKESVINSGNNFRTNVNFRDLKIFETNKLREQNKNVLANLGLEMFLLDDGLNESFNKIDILRFGIPYNLANSLSNDKIMSIMIYPVNHKYPEIEFIPFEFLYTPVLTDVSSSVINNLNITSFESHLGVYDIFNQDFGKRYRVLSGGSVANIVLNILKDIENRRLLLGFDETLRADIFNINRITRARSFSNSIKYLNESYNTVFDDEKINRLDIDFDNILSTKTKAIFDNIDTAEYLKIFNEKKSDVENYMLEENGYFSINDKQQQVENNIHSIEFLKNIDKDISNINFLKSITTEAFFDIFSVRISKEALRTKIKSEVSEDVLRYILQDKDDFSNSYSYTVQTKIY
jgi:hypothetical protein